MKEQMCHPKSYKNRKVAIRNSSVNVNIEILRLTGEVNPQRLKQTNKHFFCHKEPIPLIILTTYTNA